MEETVLHDLPCAGCPYDAGYTQLSTREGTAERRAWHWQCAFWGVTVLAVPVLILLGLVLLNRPPVQAFVQIVQETADGRVLPMGGPKDALQYDPQDAQWHSMLREWVENVRWRDSDALPLIRHRWQVAGHLTCPSASKAFGLLEDAEKPFQASKKKTSIRFESVTKSPVPRAYHVRWEETIAEGALPVVEQHWLGTFTVGRRVARDPVLNPLGICVASFQLRQES